MAAQGTRSPVGGRHDVLDADTIASVLQARRGRAPHGTTPHVRREPLRRRMPQPVPWRTMSRRIDIELTSAPPDGSSTGRAAGAREPRGVLDGTLVPADARMGAVFKADAEIGLDGTTILSVSSTKEKSARTN